MGALGIPASNAINKFYKQIILQRGLPFQVKLPQHPLNVGDMTEEQFNAELEKGYADMKAGRTVSAKQAFADIRGSIKKGNMKLLRPNKRPRTYALFLST